MSLDIFFFKNMDLIKCTKCGVSKTKNDFWFDKRRGKVRKPCRDCSRKSNSLTERLRKENNVISRSDVVNFYNGKGLPDEMVNFLSDIILLNRSIKKVNQPIIKHFNNCLYLFCPTCAVVKSLELPCSTNNLSKILSIFNDLHNHKKK